MKKKLTYGISEEILDALQQHKGIFWAIAAFSGCINILFLTPSIYMMQMYDRVLGSRSEITLLMLSLIALGMYVIMAALEYSRSRVLVRLSNQLDEQLAQRIFTAAFERNLKGQPGKAGAAMSDLTVLRQFITGQGIFAFFDAPWAPIYILVVWLFHPILGMITLLGATLLVLLTYLTDVVTHSTLTEANQFSAKGNSFATTNLRNSEVIEAMGMLGSMTEKWRSFQTQFLAKQSEASDKAAFISGLTKFVRMTLQSATLGVGAWLVLENQASPGIMIAASILASRAMAPVEQLVGGWKSYIAAKDAFQRLSELLDDYPIRKVGMDLPKPTGHLAVENVLVTPPGGHLPVIRGVSFTANPGEILVIMGPSASGKSTLSRIIVGAWQCQNGRVRIDGSGVNNWDKEKLGMWIGYLPQDIELFEGTIAENICRFSEIDSEKIIAAASKAGVHEMILNMNKGYDTNIGDGGAVLSGGQRQRVALARALYGNPSLVVLDEPNASLDEAGEAALMKAVLSCKEEGQTVVIVTHRQNIVDAADRLLVMRDGQVFLHGNKIDVLQKLHEQAQKVKAARLAKVTKPDNNN